MNATCTARIWGDPTGLQCKRTDPHDDGHVFHAAWSPDLRHDDLAEDER